MSIHKLDEADVLIVDGANLLWRSSYSNAGLGYQTEAGFQPTGGVFGFFESLLSVMKELPTDLDVFITWEGRRSRSSRRAVVPTYKKREPDEKRERLAKLVGVQASILRGCLRWTAFHQVSSPSWEGDDVMATIAESSKATGLNSLIYSSDADMLQCCDDSEGIGWVRQWKPTTKKGVNPIWTAQRIRDEWGFDPSLVADMKAIAGDPSDCYKGAPGIGDVWAKRIISEHGPLSGVIEAAAAGAVAGSTAKAATIIEHRGVIEDCLTIARVNRRCPVELTLGESNSAELRRAFARLRFHSINTAAKISRLTTQGE